MGVIEAVNANNFLNAAAIVSFGDENHEIDGVGDERDRIDRISITCLDRHEHDIETYADCKRLAERSRGVMMVVPFMAVIVAVVVSCHHALRLDRFRRHRCVAC